MIPLFKPSLDQNELLAIADSFQSGWIGKGQKVDEFESAWANHIGSNPANVVSINSCTEALFQAVQLLGIGSGDEVIIPAIHFIGAAQAVLAVGATPVFCDVDSRTLNATADNISEKITPKTKAVILNHYGGVPSEALSLHYRPIYLIEDAANAPASTYNGQAVGTFGDIGCWSFDSMKVISTGDGGMLYFRDKDLAERARRLVYLGMDSQSGLSSNKDKWWEFKVQDLGARRSIMNDIAAGIGIEQLKKLGSFVDRRQNIVSKYNEALGNYVSTPSGNGYYFYWIQTSLRDELATYLRANGIYVTFRYYPLHWAYDTSDHLPNAEKAANTTLLLPLHSSLADEQVEFIINTMIRFYEN